MPTLFWMVDCGGCSTLIHPCGFSVQTLNNIRILLLTAAICSYGLALAAPPLPPPPSPQTSVIFLGEPAPPTLPPANSLSGASLTNDVAFPNPQGYSASTSTEPPIDLGNAFFQSLGTNGRSCGSCHMPQQGWSITPVSVQAQFNATAGLAPIFRTNDGSNSPNANVSSLAARKSAYSLLLNKGLIRVGIAMPGAAEFQLIAVNDPYNFASANELSLFRRPLPTTNLKFLSTVMWDGRETFAKQTIAFDLSHQANSAVLGHEMGGFSLTPSQTNAIVNFESALSTTQVFDNAAGWLNAFRANGDPAAVALQPFYIGINDLFGDSITKAPFNPKVFNTFIAWNTSFGTGAPVLARSSIARGEAIFNTKPINITGVPGINDVAAFGISPVFKGSCSTCHNTPNNGGHSVSNLLNTGISAALARSADLPLYTFKNIKTGATVQNTDPGMALVSGKWKDMGKFKVPSLLSLSVRAPYFHNGSAKDLNAVIGFYQKRFAITFTPQEQANLLAFLRAL